MEYALHMGGNTALLAVSVLFLWRGADWFVDATTDVARHFGLSELIIGLTLVGFGTSAPEFAVSIGAALSGRPDISVGNVVGSNIFNLGFILGGCAAIRPIITSRTLVCRDGLFLIGVTGVLTLVIHNLHVSRLEGALLLGLLLIYMAILFRQRRADTGTAPDRHTTAGKGSDFAAKKQVLLLFAGLAMVLVGAHFLVYSASNLARAFGMSEWTIGVTIVAAGTSAPELFTSINAASKGRYGISAGNLIGSDLYNLLGVLGVAAMIRPMNVAADSLGSVYLLACMVFICVVFMRTGWRLSRAEGIFLVSANLVRWWVDIKG